MTVEVAPTEAAAKRRRGFALGLITLILALVPAGLFVAILVSGSSTDDGYGTIVDVAFFGVPIAIVLGAVLAIIAIVINAGRILAIVTLVLLVPQALFVAFAFYVLFMQPRG
jgi:hypothetical protein